MLKPSALREKCKRKGISKKLLERIPPYEINMRAINNQIKENKDKRAEMLSVFGVPTKQGNRHTSNHTMIAD